jgi:3-dehydroquinate dehydratase II
MANVKTAARPSAARVRVAPSSIKTIYCLNGPNANLYGHGAGAVYGTETFEDLGRRCARKASEINLKLDFRQSNHEGQIVDWIQEAMGKAQGVIINGAGLTYTSIAILDALLAFPGPIVEVHMSNIYRREPFRHHSFISKAATGIVAGLGADGYELALEAMRRLLDRPEAKTK